MVRFPIFFRRPLWIAMIVSAAIHPGSEYQLSRIGACGRTQKIKILCFAHQNFYDTLIVEQKIGADCAERELASPRNLLSIQPV